MELRISKPSDTLGYTFLGEEGKLPIGSKVKYHTLLTHWMVNSRHLELIKFGNSFTSDDGFKNSLTLKVKLGN